MPSAAAARSASARTTAGALPPSSRWVRASRSAAAAATARPARTLPVSETWATCGCDASARPGVRPAADDVEHAVRQHADEQLGHPHRRRRGELRRLEDDGVARRDRGRPLPDRHHQRVVPRRDAAADADRLAAHAGGHARPRTPRRRGPPAAGRRRRRTAAGPGSAGSRPRRRTATACRCRAPRGRPARRRARRVRRPPPAGRPSAPAAWCGARSRTPRRQRSPRRRRRPRRSPAPRPTAPPSPGRARRAAGPATAARVAPPTTFPNWASAITDLRRSSRCWTRSSPRGGAAGRRAARR